MKLLNALCICLITLSLSLPGFAQRRAREAKIIEVQGSAMVLLEGREDWVPAEAGMVLHQGDALRVDEDSWALVNIDGSGQTALLELQEKSHVMFSMLLKDDKDQSQQTLLDLHIGKILIKARKLHSETSKFEIKTPTSVVGVRGTTFEVEVESLE